MTSHCTFQVQMLLSVLRNDHAHVILHKYNYLAIEGNLQTDFSKFCNFRYGFPSCIFLVAPPHIFQVAHFKKYTTNVNPQ